MTKELNNEIQNSNLKEFKVFLDNLLDIKPKDPSLFSYVDNERYFDVYSKFGKKFFETVYTTTDFRLPLLEKDIRHTLKEIDNAQNITEIKKIFQRYNQPFSIAFEKGLEKDFQKSIKKIKELFEKQLQIAIAKWKKFDQKVKNIALETNIWPLHLGFMFVRIFVDEKAIQAPLFLKEVSINIVDNVPYISDNSDIKINEKLVQFLKSKNIDLSIDVNDFAELSIRNAYHDVSNKLIHFYSLQPSIIGQLKTKQVDDITNTKIEFMEGICLGLFQPSGGYQRQQMHHILKNNELDDIIKVEIDKNIYKNRIDNAIFSKNFNLFKVNKTNFSQDKATISSLLQNTIIWGPPGTGKSQTITNLIANILVFKKTALVVSQKRAALKVLKQRLGILSNFCLFILNNGQMTKEEFYKPIKYLIDIIENNELSSKLTALNVISESELNYIDHVDKLLKVPNLNEVIDVYTELIQYDDENKFDYKLYKALLKLPRNIKYNITTHFNDLDKLIHHLYEQNFGKKVSVFTKMFKKIPEEFSVAANIILSSLQNYRGDLDSILAKITKVEEDNIRIVDEFVHLDVQKNDHVNDEKQVAKFILSALMQKVRTFNDKEKVQYSKFATIVRTGKKDPYKFVIQNSEIIKKIFPVIISTSEFEFSGWSKNEFDYAILDESSQIFLEWALPILYLAKIKVFAGDNQQMQPSSWFSSRQKDEVGDTEDIRSILEYALAKGVYSVLLDKNYRSRQASLMTFSSKHFYNSSLDVIDDRHAQYSSIELSQVLGTWERGRNVEEAKEVINLVKQNLSQYNKIILLCFNRTQVEYIEELIFDHEPLLEEALNSKQLLLKNIENIQGDEADLVIISCCYDKTTRLHSTYVGRTGGKNALNVAISRAKEKMIVVKSLYDIDVDTTTSSSVDLKMFKEWLRFLELNDKQKKEYITDEDKEKEEEKKRHDDDNSFSFLVEPVAKVNEEFYDIVQQELEKQFSNPNLLIARHYPIGTQKMDIAIINKLTSEIIVGISLDDYHYANDLKKYITFRDKDDYLISKNYDIVKIKKIDWFIQKDHIIQNLKSKINM